MSVTLQGWERETCPTGLGKGEHTLGCWLGQVRLEINALLVKDIR